MDIGIPGMVLHHSQGRARVKEERCLSTTRRVRCAREQEFLQTDYLLVGTNRSLTMQALKVWMGVFKKWGWASTGASLIIVFSENIKVAKTSTERDFEVSPVSLILLILVSL